MVEKLKVDVENQCKVVVSFRVGDIYPHLYERDQRDQDGRKTGRKEAAALIKGRLLLINSITIDGENVFRRESGDDDQSAESHDSQAEHQYQDDQEACEPVHQARAQRPAPSSNRSQEHQGEEREVRAQAPRAHQGRPAQQSRSMPAPRQQAERNSSAYQAGHAVGRATRFVRDQAAA